MKNVILSILTVIFISVPLGNEVVNAHRANVEKPKINYTKYIIDDSVDIETEVFGEEPTTDFVPGYYGFDPYPESIRKNIEATAYCYGEITCTGKKVREGICAMSKRYIGMTAIVYEADSNGEPIDYIGTYEVEDTGGDERIKNGNCIDIYIPDHEKAVDFGRKQVVVYLIEAKG